MRLLVFLFRASRGLLLAALVTSVASGLGSAALVSLINRALSAPKEERGEIGLLFSLAALGVLLMSWLSQTLFVRLGQATLAEMRKHISQLMLDAPYRHIESQGSARLLAVLTADVQTVSDFFVTLPNLTMHGSIVLGCLLYLGTLSWPLFLLAMAITLLGAGAYHIVQQRAFRHLNRARSTQDELYHHFRALCDGAKELRLHNTRRSTFLSRLLGDSVEQIRRDQTRGMSLYVGAESLGNFLFFAFIGLVLFALSNVMALAPSVMSGYALVFLHMVLPMDALLQALPRINRTRIALSRVDRATAGLTTAVSALMPVSSEAHPGCPGTATPADSTTQVIQLSGVTHTFHREREDRAFLLGPIDLELRRGEVVFLVGGNGSGKTTLAKLVVGLYTPERGDVSLGGARVTDQSRDAYRQHFSAVFSDFYLFETLVGLTGKDLEERTTHWLEALQLDHKVQICDGQLSTTSLSQGQRKRLALLVALLEDRPFYLFDEWASDQDPEYKEIFYTRLLPELRARGKGVLAITHDDRYFQWADRCIELDSGQLRSPASTMRHAVHARPCPVA